MQALIRATVARHVFPTSIVARQSLVAPLRTSTSTSRGFASSPPDDGDNAASVDTAGMPLTWEELRSHLSMASDPKAAASSSSSDKSARAKQLWGRITRSNTPLRQDEWMHPSGVATFWLLRHGDAPRSSELFDPAAPLGGDDGGDGGPNSTVIAAMVQQNNILYGVNTHPAFPVAAAESLVRAAAAKLEPEACTALVALPGLSEWVRAGERWNDPKLVEACGEEAAEAAKAMALNKPRPGHSVLGHGTFKAAEEAWVRLANQYVDESGEDGVMGEMLMYKSALGRGAWRIHHLADTDPEYMVMAGGAMAVFKQEE